MFKAWFKTVRMRDTLMATLMAPHTRRVIPTAIRTVIRTEEAFRPSDCSRSRCA
jgi:hypothetical protein